MPLFAEPTWSGSIQAYPESFFDNEDITPFQITGAIVRLLQYQFGYVDNIDNPLLKGYIWTNNGATSKILIGPSFMRNDETTSAKPGIFVERQDLEATTIGVRYLNVQAESLSTPFATGNYNKHLTGKHLILCEGISGTEAELLAEEVFTRFMLMSPILTSDFNLDTIDVKGLGKQVPKPKQASTTFVSSVVIAWQKTYNWSIVNEEPEQ